MHRYIDGWNARRQDRCRRAARRTPSCGSCSSPTRTATSTRSTPSACGARTCATTTATARHRSATASTRTGTGRTTSSTTTRARRRSRRATPTAAPAPASEAETSALKGLLDRVDFSFHVNWHSGGPVAAVRRGLADRRRRRPTTRSTSPSSGNLDDPAIQDFHPGLSSDVLYVTNGETTDYAHAANGHAGVDARAVGGLRRAAASCSRTTRRWSRPSSSATCRSRSRSPNRRTIRTTRSRRSASRPSRSTSRATTRTRTASRARTSRSSTPTATRSRCQVLAKRSLGKVTLKYRINGGREHSASTSRVARRRALHARRRATTARCAASCAGPTPATP